jgi:SAM-dependent methyltransferase
MARVENACAGPFGAVYDLWIERERVAAVVGRLLWGIDTGPMFASMGPAVATVPDGGVIIDVPCGGGVAFRALHPDHQVRYLAVDLEDAMLARARRRADEQGLGQIEFVPADMRQLPFGDGEADLCLTYGGLHMIPDPWRALKEIGRCVRAGGEIVGTTFLADGTPDRPRGPERHDARSRTVAARGGIRRDRGALALWLCALQCPQEIASADEL